MKKIILILILQIILTSCYAVKTVISKEYYYNQNIDFVINYLEEKHSISDSPRTTAVYKSNPKDKFVLLNITLLNSSEESQKLNFNNFYLFNIKTNTQYNADWVMSSSLLHKNRDRNYQIKENGKQNMTLVFMFPKYEIPRHIKINNKIVEIKFQT